MINMTQVKIDKENLVELVDFKLSRLRKEIERILKKWNYSSSNKFLEDAKNGTISEAEHDRGRSQLPESRRAKAAPGKPFR